MEEIDIIELLKRVKEGKAPKRIEFDGTEYYLKDNAEDINDFYKDGAGYDFLGEYITFDTKIKILDKPILEELKEWRGATDVANKLNEVIRYLKSKE